MFGINEIIWGLVIVGVVALFGKKTVLKLFKEWFSIKKDVDLIIKENKTVEVTK